MLACGMLPSTRPSSFIHTCPPWLPRTAAPQNGCLPLPPRTSHLPASTPSLPPLPAELDGFDSHKANSPVICIAATNRADVLDAALLRPGRFDRRVAVERPDKQVGRRVDRRVG